MRSLGVDGNNDLFLSGNSVVTVTDLEAVLEVCAHCAKAVLGEMLYFPAQGMPYFETVWVGNPTTAPFEAAFRARILRIAGVVSIEELTTIQQGDSMSYIARIQTIYGTGSVSG